MVDNLVILQCIDIPIGINPESFQANLYLFEYETDFISSLMKTDS